MTDPNSGQEVAPDKGESPWNQLPPCVASYLETNAHTFTLSNARQVNTSWCRELNACIKHLNLRHGHFLESHLALHERVQLVKAKFPAVHSMRCEFQEIEWFETVSKDLGGNLQSIEFKGNLKFPSTAWCNMLTNLTSLCMYGSTSGLTHDHATQLASLTKLEIHGRYVGAVMEFVAPLTNLQTLTLEMDMIKDIGLLSGVEGLRELHLHSETLKGDDFEVLSGLTKLTQLDLAHDTYFDASSAWFLSTLEGLVKLNLSDTRFDTSGVEFLTHLTNLRQLEVRATRFDDNCLAKLTSLQQLAYLDAMGACVGKEGLRVLDAFMDLTTLKFSKVQVDEGFQCAIGRLAKLRHLEVRGVNPSGDFFRAISTLSRLEELVCKNMDVRNGSMVLTHLMGLQELRRLTLWAWTGVQEDSDLNTLSSLTKLERLELNGMGVSDQNVECFSHLHGLTHLNVCISNITYHGACNLSSLTNLEFLALPILACSHDEKVKLKSIFPMLSTLR